MQRNSHAWLADARDAADAIRRFTDGKSFDEYVSDELLRAAVERQFCIIGEALAQLARHDAAFAGRIPELPRIVAFRNILVHGYALVDHEQVWSAVETRLPPLCAALDALLAED